MNRLGDLAERERWLTSERHESVFVMPLCDYFLASDDELASVREHQSPGDPLTRVDAKGFDVMAIEALAKRLGLPRATAAGPPEVHGDDFEWFAQRLTPEMVAALASQSDEACAQHAGALANTDVTDWDATDLHQLLITLSSTARRAAPEARGMFMWVCT